MAELADLHDIQLPPPVSGWPPALGWWLVALAVLLFAALLAWLWGQRREMARQEAALARLDELARQYQASKDAAALLAGVSRLLRQCVIALFPERRAGGLTGEAWLQFLNETAASRDFGGSVGQALLAGPYQATTQGDVDEVIAATRRWIKHAPLQKSRRRKTVP